MSKIVIPICFSLLRDHTKHKLCNFIIRAGTILFFFKTNVVIHGTLERKYFNIGRIIGDVTKSDGTKKSVHLSDFNQQGERDSAFD